MSKDFFVYFLFSLVLLLASYLRFGGIASNPPGFYTDEASIGYNAYTILNTGRDEHGNFMPLFFKAFGEYKTPFAIYPVVLTESIFGTNEVAVRFAQGFFGIVLVTVIFFLAKEFWGKWAGLICASVIAISPWAVHLSRFNIESHNAFLAMIVLGTLFFAKFLKSKKKKYSVLSSIFFGLSFYTYFATRIFTPLYLILLLFLFRKELSAHREKLILPVLIFGIIVAPFVLHMASGKGFARYNQVSINGSGQTVGQALKKSILLYIYHFDPRFVFLLGDSDFPGQLSIRHSVTGMGLMYRWQLPFFILGFLILLFSKKPERKILLGMLALFPLGSVASDAITPQATRSVIGAVAYIMLIGLGLYKALRFLKSPTLRLGLGVLVLVLGGFYLNRFIGLSDAYVNRAYGYNGFQYGAKQIVEYFLENQSKYDYSIVYSGLDGADAYFKFFALGKCTNCYYDDGRNWEGNLIFAVANDKVVEFGKKYKGNWMRTIFYPDGREAFYIYEARTQK